MIVLTCMSSVTVSIGGENRSETAAGVCGIHGTELPESLCGRAECR